MILRAKIWIHIVIVLLLLAAPKQCFSQYPHYFVYDNENGLLPSNEVYSIVQDKKGFIWIGCDAGLYKFDGVRYTSYKCKTQTSKSISNLTLSSSDRIYCVNFQDQIFYLDNDSLKELQHRFQKISNIAEDQNGFLYVNHGNGIAVFNLKTQKWRNINDIALFTRSVSVNNKNEVYSLAQMGIVKLADTQTQLFKLPDNTENIASNFFLTCHQNTVWIFKRDGSVFYTFKDGQIIKNGSDKLSLSLQNRKITKLKSLPDGKLWICTYNGIIRYDMDKDSATIFYPGLSFSDILIDREDNYWLTTLQTGLLRVPDLNFEVWNNSNSNIKNEKLTHLATDGSHIYFSSINGTIGKLNPTNNSLQTFHTGKNADIECLFFDTNDNYLIFHSQNICYTLKNNNVKNALFQISSLKSVVHAPPFYFFGSSQGLYTESEKYKAKISEAWTRQLVWSAKNKTLYAATNKGLQIFKYKQNQWICTDTLFPKTQIISIDFDEKTQQLFTLAFDGKIYVSNSLSDHFSESTLLLQLPENVQAQKLKYHNGKWYLATNKGISVFDLKEQKLFTLNRLSGLASENVQDIAVLNGNLWLATGKGLQKIPLTEKYEKQLAKVYLKNSNTNFKLNYGKALILSPEASIYTSNGQFEYAYRINKNEWVKLPANVEQIEIQNLPAGTIDFELKVIDYLGRDSENIITLNGVVEPPFWKTWWFILSIVFLLIGLAYLFYKYQLDKQQKELRRQNELNLAKLTAIRSQMNPHFIFNSLNSIQDLILQKKTVESYDYVVFFSELVRNALNHSNSDFISIHDEIEFLDTYLQLEQLRFKNNFRYQIDHDGMDEIDVPSLMIQPFVENALFHGLLHKDDEKELSIRFTFDNDLLICIIEDNGIGRKRSEVIRTRQGQKHGSFALEAIQKRMDIFNEQQGKTVGSFLFEDLYPNQKDTGTRVIIRLPFKRRY